MPTTYKILGQQDPAVNTPVDIYVTLAGTSAIVSSITVANRGTTLAQFRVAVHQGTGATLNKDYLYYDVPIAGNDTFIATVGLTLAPTDRIRVEGRGTGGGNLSFQIFGSELT